MIRNLTRAAAALPLGAFVLGVLPFGSTFAAARTSRPTWASPPRATDGYHWLLAIDNEGSDSFDVKFAVDGGESTTFTLGAGENQHPKVPAVEGLPSTVRLFINDVEYDSESTSGVVDCITDGEVYADISIVCPDQGSDQDIFVDYEFGAPGTGAKIDYSTPDGGISDVIISDEVVHRTHKVSQGDAVDVSAWDVTDNNKVLATFKATVDCPVDEVIVVEEDTPSDGSEGSSGQLPETGNGATVAWFAAALTVLGAGAQRLSRRQVAISE